MNSEFVQKRKTVLLPRLPLDGKIDLTYRCNNHCRHCWIWVTNEVEEINKELSFKEIIKIVNEAKKMGCRQWYISGGEPMIRPDFLEIFDYITRNSIYYFLNTNGTYITPKIAKFLKRRGRKMIALCGSTSQVHDHITRNLGSFDALMRGIQYLREAGVSFIIQLIIIKDNYHQFIDMMKLARSLSPHSRIGTPWLYLSASGDKRINQEIIGQRLAPKETVKLDTPDVLCLEEIERLVLDKSKYLEKEKYCFQNCIKNNHNFYIDPYGRITFCNFVKDPRMQYELRRGSFKDAWENFIPSLARKIKVNRNYLDNCGSCYLRNDCLWCQAYGYLEHRRFNAKIDYLCSVAKEGHRFKQDWLKNHRRYFKIADITIRIESDLPIIKNTFHPKFKLFEVNGPGEDTVFIRHHFFLPDSESKDLGRKLYHKPPWSVYKKDDFWIYLVTSPGEKGRSLNQIAVFNSDYSRASIYNGSEDIFVKGNLNSLTLFSTDQILLSRILADRQGFYLHSCGVNFKAKGLLFVGHSEAGKTTIATMLKCKAEILCDDRIIIRKQLEGYKVYGTWSHGENTEISPNSAPLKAIFFLEKAKENKIIPIHNTQEILRKLLPCLIRSFVTVDWWHKTLLILDSVSRDVPCYILKFDKSGKIVDLLEKM